MSKTLSFAARGVLAFAQECGQPLTVALLMEQGCTEYEARKLLRELCAAGLATMTQTRRPGGRLGPVVYEVIGNDHSGEIDRIGDIHHVVKSTTAANSDHTAEIVDVVSNARTRKRMPAHVNLIKKLNTNTKDSVPDGTARLEIVKPTSRNDWYDAVFEVWEYTGELNGAMQKMLQGKSKTPQFKAGNVGVVITPDDLRAWAKWYRQTKLGGDPDLNMLEDRMKIASSIENWYGGPRQQADGGQVDFMRRLLGPNTILVGVPGYDPALGPVIQ